ncbi:hypothetical protein LZC95_52355 [Pendulispora brunnea]|uniref:Glycoside hydrolase 131 catalytic N-terminal domain-containing protein n=1 Tax=Pendulispora brunnea TaxID=2905690 RepID=A0ABZ2KC44_9BACT
MSAVGVLACSSLLDVKDLPALSKDAGVDAPPAPPSFCQKLQTPVTFCRDFDDGQSFYDGFTRVSESPNRLTVDEANVVSPPFALLSEVAHKEDQRSMMVRKFPGLPKEIRLSFDLFMEKGPVSPVNASIAHLDFAPDTANHHSLEFKITTNSGEVSEFLGAAGYADSPFTGPKPVEGKWQRYDIHVDVEKRHLTVALEGTTTVDTNLEGPWPKAEVLLSVGIFWVKEQNVSVIVRHDNIVLDLK